jgi:endoglucanase
MANTKYVCAEDEGNSPLIANRSYVGHWESFNLIYNIDGTISILSKANDKYVSLRNDSTLIANKSTISGDNEKFYMISNENGTVSFKSKANGMHLCVQNNDQNGLITVNIPWINTWEQFVLEYK